MGWREVGWVTMGHKNVNMQWGHDRNETKATEWNRRRKVSQKWLSHPYLRHTLTEASILTSCRLSERQVWACSSPWQHSVKWSSSQVHYQYCYFLQHCYDYNLKPTITYQIKEEILTAETGRFTGKEGERESHVCMFLPRYRTLDGGMYVGRKMLNSLTFLRILQMTMLW